MMRLGELTTGMKARTATTTKFLSPAWSGTAAAQRPEIPHAQQQNQPHILVMLRRGFLSHVYLMHDDVVLHKDPPVLPNHTYIRASLLFLCAAALLHESGGAARPAGQHLPTLYAVRTLCGQSSRAGKKRDISNDTPRFNRPPTANQQKHGLYSNSRTGCLLTATGLFDFVMRTKQTKLLQTRTSEGQEHDSCWSGNPHLWQLCRHLSILTDVHSYMT
jgi:hypothetical protein